MSEREKSITISYVIEKINKHREVLIKQISNLIRENIFENSYTIHPRMIRKIAEEEIDTLILYLKKNNFSIVQATANERAEKGLNLKTILEIHELIKKHLIDEIGELKELTNLLQVLKKYAMLYLTSYFDTTKSIILSQQEQLRKALTKTIDTQRTEILIKNQAIETSPNGVLITDLEGNITFVNGALRKMFKITPYPQTTSSIREFINNQQIETISSSLKTHGYWQGEITIDEQQTGEKYFLLSASFIKDQQSNNIGIMYSFIDLTEQKKLEAQVRQAQKMEALGQLASGISHDFNNILAAISGYAELQLLDFEEGTQEYKDMLQIKLAAERGKELTRQLLFFTKRDTLKRTSININNNIMETITILKRTFPPEITIKTNLADNLKPINANHSQINQILMNLFVNSRDAIVGTATEKENVAVEKRGIIRVSTFNTHFNSISVPVFKNAKPGEYVCLKVSDSGMGMPKEVVEHIFEPFYTTKRAEKGTGLGLSVVYGIVQSHNGFIRVKSEVGKGTTFEIFFPVAQNTSTKRPSKSLTDNIYPGEGTILVVEDEIQVRSMEKRILEKCGYTVLTVENGREAIKYYQQHRKEIDLIVLDMIMPEMGGKECFYKLKEIDPEVKIVIITGYKTDAVITRFIRDGVSGVIEKPFKLYDFTREVYKALHS